MPNYKYQCDECEHLEWKVLSMSSDPSIRLVCPQCGAEAMSRRIVAPSNIVVERETLGKWYKKRTGREFMGND